MTSYSSPNSQPRLMGFISVTASRDLTTADCMQTLLVTLGEVVTLTLPASIETGFWCYCVDMQAGITFAAGAGATVLSLANNLDSAGAGGVILCFKRSTTAWVISGDLA